MTAISTVHSKKRMPMKREFLNMAKMVLSNLASSGKMYIRIMA